MCSFLWTYGGFNKRTSLCRLRVPMWRFSCTEYCLVWHFVGWKTRMVSIYINFLRSFPFSTVLLFVNLDKSCSFYIVLLRWNCFSIVLDSLSLSLSINTYALHMPDPLSHILLGSFLLDANIVCTIVRKTYYYFFWLILLISSMSIGSLHTFCCTFFSHKLTWQIF